jgi:2-desacetyl-2-hydroxyethyl bacteriochlorophyllide A dehydrogenase
MRALIVPEKGRLELADIPMPEITPYQALVKTEVCGICSSTDWKVIQGQMGWAGPFPLVLGHESVGTVVETGAKVTKFRVGDRVTRVIYPRSARLNSAFGGFAEFGIVTDALDPLHASLCISLAETASGMSGVPNLRHRSAVVAGTGVAGLAFTLWAKLAGAKVATLGRRESRLAHARSIGADVTIDTRQPDWQARVHAWADGKVDGVIEAIGDTDFAATLLELLKPDGFAAAYGAPPDGKHFSARWVGMPVEEQRSYAWAADLIGRGVVKPSWFISHTWDRLDDAPAAFDAVRRGDVLKGFIRIH